MLHYFIVEKKSGNYLIEKVDTEDLKAFYHKYEKQVIAEGTNLVEVLKRFELLPKK